MTEGVTHYVAQYGASTGLENLPLAVKHEATRSFLNILGCTIGGALHPSVDVTLRALLPLAGPPTCILIGRKERADPLLASLVNAMSASVYTFDDTHAEAMVHPSAPVAAALLALSDGVSGKQFLVAFTLGAEIMCRLSKAVSVSPAQASLPWVQTGIAGSVSAAIACARLMNLSVEHTVAAIGIAAATASGLRIGAGTQSMPFKLGVAAQSGLRAALLASGGMTASKRALEEEFGFFRAFSEQAYPDALTEGLGERHELLSNTYKLYPCGVVVHPVIKACLELWKNPSLDCAAIKRIHLLVNPTAAKLADSRHPETEAKAQISLQHWAAAVLSRGAADLHVLSQACLNDAKVRMLREKTDIESDGALSRETASVTIELQNGKILKTDISNSGGSRSLPPTDQELELKFRTQAATNPNCASADVLIQHCWNLSELNDMKIILDAAAGAGNHNY